jgi:uncharacterized protein YndB with AHSA1/START domain
MTAKTIEITVLNDLEIRTRRAFNAPRRLLFDAHFRPELVRRWINGPDGWEMDKCEVDLRPGGRYRFELRRTDGPGTMGWGGTFLEVEAPERVVHTELFDEDWTGGETTVTILFRELAPDRSEVELTVRYASKEGRDMALSTGMEDGMEMGYAHIDALVASGEWR